MNYHPGPLPEYKGPTEYEDAIENIDIGGPAMLRAAAKNHNRVTVITDPNDYTKVIEEIRKNNKKLMKKTKKIIIKKTIKVIIKKTKKVIKKVTKTKQNQNLKKKVKKIIKKKVKKEVQIRK